MSIRFENTRRQHASFSRCGHSVSSEKGKPGRGLRASAKLNPGNRLKTVQDCTVFCPATGHDDAWRLLPWKRSRNIASRTKTVNLKNLWIASRNSRHRRKPPEQKRPGERWTITPEKQAVDVCGADTPFDFAQGRLCPPPLRLKLLCGSPAPSQQIHRFYPRGECGAGALARGL